MKTSKSNRKMRSYSHLCYHHFHSLAYSCALEMKLLKGHVTKVCDVVEVYITFVIEIILNDEKTRSMEIYSNSMRNTQSQ